MTEQQWYAGVDWASESHHVFLTDGAGRKIGEKIFKHSGEGLAEMAAWLLTASGAARFQPNLHRHRSAARPRGGNADRARLYGSCHQSETDGSLPRPLHAGRSQGRQPRRRGHVFRSAPMRTVSGCWPPSIQPSSNCANGRASQATLHGAQPADQSPARATVALLPRHAGARRRPCAEWLLDLWEIAPTPARPRACAKELPLKC